MQTQKGKHLCPTKSRYKCCHEWFHIQTRLLAYPLHPPLHETQTHSINAMFGVLYLSKHVRYYLLCRHVSNFESFWGYLFPKKVIVNVNMFARRAGGSFTASDGCSATFFYHLLLYGEILSMVLASPCFPKILHPWS